MINKSHTLANFLKVSLSIYATTLQIVKYKFNFDYFKIQV